MYVYTFIYVYIYIYIYMIFYQYSEFSCIESLSVLIEKCLQSFIALYFVLYCPAQLQGVSSTLI